MPTIQQCIERLMPEGTNGDSGYSRVPLWPPDVFAVCATMARLSECYTLAAVRGGMGFSISHVMDCQHIGESWSKFDVKVQPLLQHRWDVLMAHASERV